MLVFAIVGTVAPSSNATVKCEVTSVCLIICTYGATWGPIRQAGEFIIFVLIVIR